MADFSARLVSFQIRMPDFLALPKLFKEMSKLLQVFVKFSFVSNYFSINVKQSSFAKLLKNVPFWTGSLESLGSVLIMSWWLNFWFSLEILDFNTNTISYWMSLNFKTILKKIVQSWFVKIAWYFFWIPALPAPMACQLSRSFVSTN